MRPILALATTVTLALSATAYAADQRSPSEIADFFVKSADLGAQRGICIGNEAECTPTQAKPEGLDMLVTFGFASDQLTPTANASLSNFVEALRDERLRAAKFVIEGHTDATGSDAYNEGLAERRAASVKRFIEARGIASDKLVAIGMGERKPRVADPFAGENRRVEMRVSVE